MSEDASLGADGQAGAGIDDVSPLAWVQAELRRTLESAHKSLRRHLKEAEAAAGSDVDAPDPAHLRNARALVHQGLGALELVGQPVLARVLGAAEGLLQRAAARPALLDTKAVDAVEHASFALLDFLGRQVAGKSVSPLLLFAPYRELRQRAGADRAHPADLWPDDGAWHALPRDAHATPRAADDAARAEMESLVLSLMRQPEPAALAQLSDLCAALGEGAREAGTEPAAAAGGAAGDAATFWQLAAAVAQAQAVGWLAADVHVKRVASRLLAQLRGAQRAAAGVAPADPAAERAAFERLARDLLFFCAHAAPPADADVAACAPRLAAVRAAWGLDRPDDPRAAAAAADYDSVRLGRFDPAWLALARKRVAAAKELWSGLAAGESHRLPALNESFALVGDSLRRLFPAGEGLAQSLAEVAQATVAAGGAEPPAPLAMEVATSLLYVEACLEEGELDAPELGDRVTELGARVDAVRGGAEAQPLALWMEELYRRVSDRQTLGSVVHELRATLSEVEKLIDQYFRNPADRRVLVPVPGQLQAMRGVLSVLGLAEASRAVLHMSDDVDALAQTEVEPQRAIQAGTFDRLADNLGALSFLIDLLGVQPQLAKSLFRFDAEAGQLRALMGQPERESAFAAFDSRAGGPGPDAADAGVAAGPPALATEPGPAPAAVAVEAAAPAATGLEDDLEMREVFIDEAREVVAEARAALERLAAAPEAAADMTVLRRAFHTLKGSARMVGLDAFGAAAWAAEQLFNARLATAPVRMDAALRDFTAPALDFLAGWTEALAAGRDDGHRAPMMAEAADALRLRGEALPVVLPAAAPLDVPVVAEPVAEPVAEAPADAAAEAQPFELVLDLDTAPTVVPEPVAEPVPPPAAADEAPLAFDFALDFAATPEPETEAVPEPTAAALPSLAERVPDLPSADDLELAPPASLPVPAAVDEVVFDLDLADLDAEPSPERAPEPEPGSAAEVPPGSAAVEAQAVELEPQEMQALFATAPLPEPAVVPPPEPQPEPEPEPEEEPVKQVGPLRIGIPLFNIFLNEADELSRRLGTELAEWTLEHAQQPVPDRTVALAHSLAGSSATVGYAELSALGRALEHALMRSQAGGAGRAGEPELFTDAADEIRRLLHQFAAGFLRPVSPELMQRLADHERWPGRPPEALAEPAAEPARPALFAPAFSSLEAAPAEPLPVAPQARADAFDDDQDLDAVDAVDAELFPIFEEEAEELLPQLQRRLRDWVAQPASREAPDAAMRTLHTFKGGARLAGAMRLGEMAHRLETAVEHLLARGAVEAAAVEPLLARADAMSVAFAALQARGSAPAPVEAGEPAEVDAPPPAFAEPVPEAMAEASETAPPPEPGAPAAAAAPAVGPLIDWTRFRGGEVAQPAADRGPSAGAVRVRAALLDRLVNQAGEVSITRARIDGDVRTMQTALADLGESLERLRRQLRDIELQAESQIASRIEAAKASAQGFDPLEMDRFTRFQELTRFMAESVNDVATTQRGLQRTLQSTEDDLAAQARLSRELLDDLLRTRMVEFESLADRLYRTVRQAAKDTGKPVRLDLLGGAIEIDRGVLDRMVGPFEHLLRNAVAHGIEPPEARAAAGKPPEGQITVQVAQLGNEVAVEFRDDGAGLDLPRIRELGVARGLLAPQAQPSDAELAQLIFAPGFSTAGTVTELAGRGVGMDVVRAEVNAMGGRIETASTPGQGTRFRLVLPLTTAVTQVVMLRAGGLSVAVPASLVEVVRRVPLAEAEAATAQGRFAFDGEAVPFFWLPALLQSAQPPEVPERTATVVVVRSAAQRVALQVDDVPGNQEVVVKNVGPQLARLPGLAGVTLLPSGAVALIYNPVALAAVYGEAARALMRQPRDAVTQPGAHPGAPALPLVMVVDDSLTVRRVTQRLLVREGYRVVLAKDGLEALERLAEERPAVLLTDIEMPRMDGFDLLRNVRADARLAGLPVVMISSRIAQKHRDHAAELGVDHYLGKPYSEEQLLALVAGYVAPAAASASA